MTPPRNQPPPEQAAVLTDRYGRCQTCGVPRTITTRYRAFDHPRRPDMAWPEQLAQQIQEALATGQPQTITVDTQVKADLGRIAAQRLARQIDDADPELLTFEVVNDGR